uniref:Chlorophyll a-b binding protein, chloroplastic n=1 Tax=Alexandrium catenella TaxID=2925 RepID=A0A7S1QB50_ALECA
MVRAEVAFAAGGAAVYSLGRAFVPGSAGNSIQPAPALRVAPAQQLSAAGAAESACMAAAAAVTTAAVGMAALRRQGRAAESRVARSAGRRELAIAYEDSGISLLDNGKFAQGLVGSEGAWGTYEFDPVGFSKYTELVPFFREAELKHGRIAMLAWVGLVVPDFIRIPGERYSFEAIPVSIDGHNKLNGAVGVNFQVLFWIAIVEFCCAKKVFEWNSIECAGDYGFGLAFFPKDEEGQRKMRMAELKNGRLAMIAFGGAISQAALTRHPFPWLY